MPDKFLVLVQVGDSKIGLTKDGELQSHDELLMKHAAALTAAKPYSPADGKLASWFANLLGGTILHEHPDSQQQGPEIY